MKPAPFDYYAPATVEEAVQHLADLGDGAKVLAGGQSLVPMLNLRLTRFAALVDIGRVPELREVRLDGQAATVGATVAQCEVERDAALAAAVPLLARATPLIGHFQIRSRGTVGGSIAHADPAGEYPVVALTLDADIEVAGPNGRRTIPAADFFVGTWMTQLAADEIVTGVRFPVWDRGSTFAIEEVARRHGDFAIAGAAVGVTVVEGHVTRAAIGLFGMGHTPVRASVAEGPLVGTPVEKVDTVELGELAVEDLRPPDDLHASSALRRRVGAAMVCRALERTLEEAGRG